MNNHYTLIAYRPNGDDYCRGCLMDSSDSAFELTGDDSLEVIANTIAQYIFHNSIREREFCEWEMTFLINGIYVSGTGDYSSSRETPDEYYKIWDDVYTKGANLAGELIQKKKAEDITKRNAQIEAQRLLEVEKERKELQRLLNKYTE